MGESDNMSKPFIEHKPSYSIPMDSADGELDPMIKDKKILELSGYEVIPVFLLNLLILFPIWLALLLPLVLIYQSLLYVYNASLSALGMKKKRKSSRNNDLSSSSNNDSTIKITMKSKKDLDLIVFGATGFTGQMAAKYIAKRYGNSFKWGIAGRRMDALQTLKNELISINPALADLPIIIADTNDIDSLEKMVKKSNVIISTTGTALKSRE